MYSNIQEGYIRLFEEAQIQTRNFSRKLYKDSFEEYYRQYKELLAVTNQLMEDSLDKGSLIHEIACIIPDYANKTLACIKKKNKRESIVLDYNMALVTFVLPVINHERLDNYKVLSDAIVGEWNKQISKFAIKNTTYEEINGGFKNRLCYITTAVCESLGKPDDCYELEVLRNYRDDFLIGENAGRDIVQEYYNVAPTIVKRINKRDDARDIYIGIWSEYLVPCIQLIEAKKLYDCKEVYSNMVYNLQKKYLYS